MMVGGRVRFMAAGRALEHRNFRLFFFGQLISVTGTWMQIGGPGLAARDAGRVEPGHRLLGLLGVVQFLPVLVLGLFGGIIADIWPKRMHGHRHADRGRDPGPHSGRPRLLPRR